MVTVSQLPDRALRMPDTRQFDASAPQRRVGELRRLVAERQRWRCASGPAAQWPRSYSGSSGFGEAAAVAARMSPRHVELPKQRDSV